MDQEKKQARKSYSDLEAIVTSNITARQSYLDAKFVVPATPNPPRAAQTQGHDAPEAVTKEEQFVQDAKALFNSSSPSDTRAPPPPAYFLVDSKGQTQALYTAPSSTPSDAGSIINFKGAISPVGPPTSGGWWKSLGEGKRVCGMRRNVCLVVSAGVCALIFGLLTTILLVTAPKGGKNGPNGIVPMFSTQMLLEKEDIGPVLAASNIAAMNWTTGGSQYTGVFYQSGVASGTALMLAIQNEGDGSWSTVNISASASSTKLDVLRGTPLAAASNNGLYNLYYLTTGNTIAEIYSSDPLSPTGWLKGSFDSALGYPEVTPGSGLGAMWQLCDNCEDALFVTWQKVQSGQFVYANMTNLTWGGSIEIDGAATPGTATIVNAFTDSGRSAGGDHDAIRFYHMQGNGLIETLKGPLGSGRLVTGNGGDAIASNLSTTPPPKMASLTYGLGNGEAGWNNNLMGWIDPFLGTVKAGNWLNGKSWTVAEPIINDSPEDLLKGGFSAIAMTQSMKIYLFSPIKGEIHEYLATSNDAMRWAWQTQVAV